MTVLAIVVATAMFLVNSTASTTPPSLQTAEELAAQTFIIYYYGSVKYERNTSISHHSTFIVITISPWLPFQLCVLSLE